jgi:transmembrane sensor
VRSFDSGHGLEVRLLEGKAHLSQDHDPTRPLRILSGRTIVEDLGTDFEVTKKANSTEISVQEGEVRITQCGAEEPSAGTKSITAPAGDHATRTVVLRRNQTIDVDERHCERRSASETPKTQELASSGGVTIRDAIALFNRNNRNLLIVADPKIANLKVGGIIKASEFDGFLLFLHRELKVIALPREAPPDCSVFYLTPET